MSVGEAPVSTDRCVGVGSVSVCGAGVVNVQLVTGQMCPLKLAAL